MDTGDYTIHVSCSIIWLHVTILFTTVKIKTSKKKRDNLNPDVQLTIVHRYVKYLLTKSDVLLILPLDFLKYCQAVTGNYCTFELTHL